MKHIIYGLYDPITQLLHYIGYTSNPENRYSNHCDGNSGTKEKRIWIRQLKKKNLRPIMKTIQEYECAEDLSEAEIYWWNYFQVFGDSAMYNDPDYIGKGPSKGHMKTEETKKKISDALRRRVCSDETRKKLSDKGKGNKRALGFRHSEETKKKMSDSHKGKPMHPAMIHKSKKLTLRDLILLLQ